MVITEKKALLPIGNCAITNGPAKYDFQASLFDHKVVQFSINTSNVRTTIDIGMKFNVSIHLAGPEDGSGDSWIGEFNITSTVDSSLSEKRAFHYNTRTRKGVVMESIKKWKLV